MEEGLDNFMVSHIESAGIKFLQAMNNLVLLKKLCSRQVLFYLAKFGLEILFPL